MLSEKIQNFQKCVKTYYFDTPTQKIMSDDVFRPNGAVSHDLTAENWIFEKIKTKNMLFFSEWKICFFFSDSRMEVNNVGPIIVN